MNFPPILYDTAKQHKFPLLFATVSGAHLYGFPSPDSDFDLRGVHVLPVREIAGLDVSEETITITSLEHGIELDLVTHDIKKFFLMLLKKNGYVLEQVLSPLIIHTTDQHQELKELARKCITRHHVQHYKGFAINQWALFNKTNPPKIKPLLYVFRVLLTGIYLMRSGELEANINKLNESFHLSYIDELVRNKVESREKQTLPAADMEFYSSEFQRLFKELEAAGADSKLPEKASTKEALNDLLIRVRMMQV